MTTPANQILGLLQQVNSQDELRSLMHEVNRRFRELQPTARQVAANTGIGPGSRVSFLNSKTGERIYGRVDKMNQKTVNVIPEGQGKFAPHWRVSPGLLRAEPAVPAPTVPA